MKMPQYISRRHALLCGGSVWLIPTAITGESATVGPIGDESLGVAEKEFETRAQIAATQVSGAITYLRSAGYSVVGDGGGALYKRVASEPSHALKVPSADGAWWEQVSPFGEANIRQAGADGAGDDTAALTAVHGAVDHALVPKGTFTITDYSINHNKVIEGENDRTTVLVYAGTGIALSTIDDAGTAKTYGHRLANIGVRQTGGTKQGAGVRLVDVGGSELRNVEIDGFAIGAELRGSVGSMLHDVTIRGSTVGIKAGGGSALEATTMTDVRNGVITLNDYAFESQGELKAFHVSDTIIESNRNLVNGTAAFLTPIFRNCWFESNTAQDLEQMLNPYFDTCYWSGDNEISGGVNPVWRHVHITGATNFAQFYTPTEVSEVSAATERYKNTGQHGLKLSMPMIGSASTPVDKQYTQGTAQSQLVGELAGTLFGYSQPVENRVGKPVSQTSFDANGYWPFGGATVTPSLPDMFGGNNATKLEIGSGSGYHGSTSLSFPASPAWGVFQIAFEMVAPDEVFGLWLMNVTLTDKRNYYKVGDTELRVAHMLFKKGSETATRFGIILPPSGIIVHRVCAFAGTQLKPMIAEGRNISLPFIQEFNRVRTFGSAAPVSGDWEQGDVIKNTVPTKDCYNMVLREWICTASGAPGIWEPQYVSVVSPACNRRPRRSACA